MSDADIAKILKERNNGRRGTATSLTRIPDLMLYRKFVERRANEHEFLVIEIKRPGVLLGHDELKQIEDYARAITNEPFADKDKTDWVFYLISDEIHPEIEDRINHDGLPPNVAIKPKGKRYEIRVVEWSKIFQSAEGRHHHLREWLQHNVDLESALQRTRGFYGDLLPKPKKKAKSKKRRKKMA